MSYPDGEALILTSIRTLARYGTNNTSRGKRGILNSGKARVYAILMPGPFTLPEAAAGGTYHDEWQTSCEVWVRYKDSDEEVSTELQAARQEIINNFRANNKAGDTTDTIISVAVTSGGQPGEFWEKGGEGPIWKVQELVISWMEQANVTPTE